MKNERRTHVVLLAALLIVNVGVKVSLWVQPPQTFPDSSGYLVPAMSLLDGRGYGVQENGFRTPAYPLFIAALLLPFDHADLSTCRQAREPACLGEAQQTPGGEANLRVIVAAQIVLGMLTILLVYAFAWRASQNAWIAALCAVTYPIDLSTGYWEISILTDTLTTFLLMLAVGLTLVAERATRHQWPVMVALGGVLGALALCHPVFLFYAVVPAAFLWWRVKPRAALAPVLLIPLLLVVAWSARNYVRDGYFTPSSIAGYNLTQMVGPFMEEAPAPYRDLATIYLDYRSQREAIRGSHSGTIFFAYRDMLAERGISWAELSAVLGRMSLQMIVEHPLDYGRVAWASFVQFWKFGLGRQNSTLPWSYDAVKWFNDTRVHQALMVLFFASPLALAFLRRGRIAADPQDFWIWFAIITVLYEALFSSATNFGDNERYRTHVARLQYAAVILTAWWLARRYWMRRPAGAPAVAGE